MITRTFALSLLLSGAVHAGDRALVIGIDDYAALEGAPELNGAVNDANAVAAELSGRLGFPDAGITVLTDGAADHDAILTALIDDLVGGTMAGDRVFLYFAGLGTTLDDGSPALVAFDGDSVLGRIPLGTIGDILDLMADRDVTVVLDTGFDGGLPGTRGLAGGVTEGPLTVGEAATFWAAAGVGQFVWENLDRGAFTEAWETAIASTAADADGDGVLTNGELSTHLTDELGAWCAGHEACAAGARGFEPVFRGDPDGIVVRYEPPEGPREPLEPLIADDGAPASFRETLGFVTDLFAPSNEAGLSLAIRGGAGMKLGDFVTFEAKADRPGTLLLLDVDPEGRLAQVYPSSLTAEGGTRLAAGEALTIPSAMGASGRPLRIRVTEPAGQGLLLGLFIEGDLPQLTALMPAGLAGGPVPNAGQSLFEISQSLLRLEADPDRPVAWSATYLPYRIER